MGRYFKGAFREQPDKGGFLVHTPKAKVSPRVCPRHASNKGLKKLAVLDVRCS